MGSDPWYPLAPWLDALHDIAASVGPNKMYEIGRQVPKNAPFPATISDVRSALGSVDIAYHMNHRRDGQIMFEPATSTMLEGIGHYWAVAGEGKSRVVVECREVPYPCEFDRGLLVVLATRFEPNATVKHTADSKCRRNGGDACKYLVSW